MMLGDDLGLSPCCFAASRVSWGGTFFSGMIRYFCAASFTFVMKPAAVKG